MAKQRVVWESFIVRFERDLEQMCRAAAVGDPICRKFFIGLQQWLKHCHEASEAPLCLTCEQEFHTHAWPFTFMVTYSEDPRVKQIVLTGVCARCSTEKSNPELLKYGGELLATKFFDGRVLGFHGPSSQDTQ
jgi:hypothetical protein